MDFDNFNAMMNGFHNAYSEMEILQDLGYMGEKNSLTDAIDVIFSAIDEETGGWLTWFAFELQWGHLSDDIDAYVDDRPFKVSNNKELFELLTYIKQNE